MYLHFAFAGGHREADSVWVVDRLTASSAIAVSAYGDAVGAQEVRVLLMRLLLLLQERALLILRGNVTLAV
jgi:hypothetical protein